MHVCIIGSGVSGLMTAFAFKDLNFIKKITVIESKKIPPVKIGESTTLAFNDYVYKHFDLKKFVTSTDATVKYGVCYDNWSSRPYLNFSIHPNGLKSMGTRDMSMENYFQIKIQILMFMNF